MKKLFEHFKSRWTNENLKELREQHYYNENKKYFFHPVVGDVVIIHEDVLKHCDWRIEKIVDLIKSKDGKIRSAKVDVISKDKIMTLKRPINKLFPVEFNNQKNIELNFVNEKIIPQVVVGALLHNQEYKHDLKIT